MNIFCIKSLFYELIDAMKSPYIVDFNFRNFGKYCIFVFI